MKFFVVLAGMGCAMIISAPDALAQSENAALKSQAAYISTGKNDAEVSAAVRRTVHAIIDYTRWPGSQPPGTICIVGATKFGNNLANISVKNGSSIKVRAIDPNPSSLAGCDVVYLGQLSMQQMRAMTAAVRNQAVLTIAEHDPDCHSRSMFCLIFYHREMTFRMDLDAISRSIIRVDPRILRLAESGKAG